MLQRCSFRSRELRLFNRCSTRGIGARSSLSADGGCTKGRSASSCRAGGQPIPRLLYSAMPFAGWIEIAVNFPEEDIIPYNDGWPFFVYSNIIG